MRLVEAMAGKGEHVLRDVRDEVESAMGQEALVDAVGVSALFHLMNRVANGTGTPLDAVMAGLAPSVTDQFGANEYLSSQDTPR